MPLPYITPANISSIVFYVFKYTYRTVAIALLPWGIGRLSLFPFLSLELQNPENQKS